jgi:pimeloyl-ACP methyl ester carboxylesterase
MRMQVRNRVLKWSALALGLILISLYLVFPIGMGVAALWPARADIGQPPAGFTEVNLTTAGGENLSAWYLPPQNGAAVILLHGAGGSRESVRAYAELLARRDYGVLAVDLRGHGQSSGKTNRLGWMGSPDVGAAVDYLLDQADVERIGGLGISMGGEVLLGASAQFPQISAIIADGATRRSLAELLALPSERPLVRNFTARVFFGSVQLLGGGQPPAPLLDEMRAAPSTRFFLIAAGENEQETAFNQLFAENLGANASLWIVPGVGHTGAFSRYPQEYEQRLIAFFDGALPADTAAQ